MPRSLIASLLWLIARKAARLAIKLERNKLEIAWRAEWQGAVFNSNQVRAAFFHKADAPETVIERAYQKDRQAADQIKEGSVWN